MVDPLERSVISYMHGQFILIDEQSNVADAVKEMKLKKAETIIVTKGGKKLVGIVTDSDILDKVVMKGEDSDQIYLKSIMSYPLITISAKATVEQALQSMRVNTIKHLPITSNENIIGIVTQESLAAVIRTAVLERTFRSYRISIRERYKPVLGNLGILMQFAGILMIVPALLGTIFYWRT